MAICTRSSRHCRCKHHTSIIKINTTPTITIDTITTPTPTPPPLTLLLLTQELVVEFFEEHYKQPPQSQGGTRRRETRVMVFASLRETTKQIVDLLAKNQPSVRAVEFVGQQGGATLIFQP
jgi:hypothetical protein